jgi:putative flippase GtrA
MQERNVVEVTSASPPVTAPPAEVPPAEVPPAEVPPAEVPPAEVPPAEVPQSWRARVRLRHPLLVQLVRYAVVGGLGTLVNALVFLVLRTWLDSVPANLVALVVSTAVSTEVNRLFTFGGAAVRRWRTTVQNGGTVLFYGSYSSAVLLLLGWLVHSPTPVQETLVVAGASVLGGIGRFLVLRYWVFGADEHDADLVGDLALQR